MQKISFLSFIVLLITISSCKNANKQSTSNKDSIANAANAKVYHVTVENVVYKNFKHYIDLYGTVESDNVYNVTAKNGGGQVKEIFVLRGDNVKKGQKLLQLENSILLKSLQAANQNIESLKTQLNFASTLYQKQQNLYNEKIGSEVQLITAKNNVDNITNQIKVIEQQINVTKEQIAQYTIYSEVEGTVEELNVRIGESFYGVSPQGIAQIKIVNNKNLKIKALVPENYLPVVKQNASLIVNLPNSTQTFNTHIYVIGRIIDPLTRSFYVEAKLPADNLLKPNQLLQIKILDQDINRAITIPINILQKDEISNFIFIAENVNGVLVAKKQIIETGIIYGNEILIKKGLQPNMQVITTGYQNLFDGQTITTK